MSATTTEAHDRPLEGICWAVLAVLTASMILALPKWVGGDLPPVQITLLRYLTGFLTIAPFFLFIQIAPDRSDDVPASRHTLLLHTVRAFLAVVRISLFFYAVTHMPFANAQAITLTNGVFMIIFATLLLHERPRSMTLVAAAFCLAGGIIAAEPDWQAGGFLSYGALAALAGAALWGIEAAIIRYTAVRDNTVRIVFTVNLIALALVALPGLLLWKPMGGAAWLALAFIGPLAIMTQVSNVRAFRVADANLLAPFRYVSVVFALAIGWFVFGEWPSPSGMIGMAVIIVSGVVLTLNAGGFPRRLA